MRILVTGGGGFVGSHIIEGLLKDTDWEIVILDSLNYAASLNRILDIGCYEANKDRITFVWHDLKAPISDTVHNIIGKLDYCWHMAAESHVENSLHDAIPFAYNVIGTTNLLQYLREKQPTLQKYIGFNTDEVFGPALDGQFYKETDKFYPSNPYSASKAGQWCMEHAFYKSFGMPIIQVHSMNIFGERQHPEKFIPMAVKQIFKKQPITIHGVRNTDQISSRCWIHAREVCNGLLFLTKKGVIGQTYNIIGEEENVLNLANKISQVIKGRDLKDKEINWVDFHHTRPGHDLRYALSGEKMKQFGWVPRFTLNESFGRMIRWMIQSENLKWL